MYSTNNTDRHDITEILLKVALNIIIFLLCVREINLNFAQLRTRVAQ